MLNQMYQYGDRVLHTNRPEWGVGSVTKVEDSRINGKPTQRLTIRFPNAGLKSIIAGAGVELRKVAPNGESHVNGEAHSEGASPLAEWVKMSQSEWLTPLAQRKIRETMTRVPEECTDAFISLRRRLANTLALFRFDKSGRGLMDWAVAQSGLDDPLTKFTRQELEQLYDRWVTERDSHLAKLLHQAAHEDRTVLSEALSSAPPAGREAVKKHMAVR